MAEKCSETDDIKPSTNLNRERIIIEYNKSNIEKILSASSKMNIEVFLSYSIDNTVSSLNTFIADSTKDELFRLILHSKVKRENSLFVFANVNQEEEVDAACLLNLRFSNKRDYFKLDIIPIINDSASENLCSDLLELYDFEDVWVRIRGPLAYRLIMSKKSVAQVIEYIRLRIGWSIPAKTFVLNRFNFEQCRVALTSIENGVKEDFEKEHKKVLEEITVHQVQGNESALEDSLT